MSRNNGWVKIDKMLAQDFKHLKRTFSRIEAMFSYTVDVDNGIDGTIAGYATQWGWSRNKVRRFVNCIRTDEGHLKDSKRTHEGHPIHFIDNGFHSKKDTSGTGSGQVVDTCHDTTNKTKTKTKTEESIYTRVVDYLNRKTNSKFKPKTKATIQFIDARVKEGFLPEDFKAVIDFKSKQWIGDPENQQYLRPATLFGNKFEGYLEAARRAQSPINGTPRATPEQTQDFLKEALS